MAETGTIDSLAIEIGASSQNAVDEISALATALGRLKQVVSGRVPNMEKWATELQKVAAASKQIDSVALAKTASAFAKLNTIKKVSIPKNLPDSLRNLSLAVSYVKPEAIENLDRMTRAMQRLSNVKQENIRAFSRFRVPKISENAGNGIKSILKSGNTEQKAREMSGSVSALQSMASSSSQATEKLVRLISALMTATKVAGKFARTIIAAPFKAFSDKVKGLTGTLGNLINSFKRILFYRVIRTVIKEIGEAFSEGQENAYWYSRKVGEATQYISEAYDAFATASFQMKNQIGAAWATLFATLEPIIEQIISMVTKAAQVVTQFFAAFGGKSTYMRALEYPKQWAEEAADAADDAAEATKEWKNQLMGFDEINRLEDQSSAASGKNKNGKTSPEYELMFEEVPVDSTISDLVQKMKDLWNKQDWKGLGELIGNTLNDLFPSPEKWEEWGDKIGGFLNGIIQTIYYTLKTIDFYEWGNRIASGFNHLIDSIDFYVLGELFVRRFTAMFDFIIGFLSGADFELIGEKISAFFRGAFDEATSWLQQYEWKEAGEAFKQKVKDVLDGLHVEDLANSIGKFLFQFNVSVADFIRGLDIGGIAIELGDWIARGIDNIDLGAIMVSLANLAADILLEIPSILLGVEAGMSRIGASVFRSLGMDWAANILDGMADDMESSRQDVKGVTDTMANKIRETMLEAVGGTHGKLGEIGAEGAQDLADGMRDAVGSHYSGKFEMIGSDAAKEVDKGWDTEISNTVSEWPSDMQKLLDGCNNTLGIASPSSEFEKTGQYSVEGLEKGWSDNFGSASQKMIDDVKNTFNQIVAEIQQAVESMKRTMNFTWSIPRPKIPKITWTYTSVKSGDGSTFQIPQFNVSWFAKGGVFDRATLFGMGEVGAEAIVPLERNTEWIGKVAAEMNRQQDANPSDRDQAIVDALYDMGAQIVTVFRETGQRPIDNRIYVNGREFYRATYDDRKAVDNEHGISMIVT